MKRRSFLKICAATGGGLLIGFQFEGCTSSRRNLEVSRPNLFQPNAWIQIGDNGLIKLLLDRSEMGQGVMTALPMLIAEELEVGLDAISVEFATGDPNYASPQFMIQITSASASVRDGWIRLRQAGAAARDILIKAAAQSWNIDPELCKASNGYVIDVRNGRQIPYADLAARAMSLPVRKVILKNSCDFKLIGTSAPRLDLRAKVTGSAVFGLDVDLPDMLTAVVARPPVTGAKPLRFNRERVEQMNGVRYVGVIESGIAVVADSFWLADRARSLLEVDWDVKADRRVNTDTIRDDLRQAARSGLGRVLVSEGDYERAKGEAIRVIRTAYELPFQAHATMEPMNCTAHVRKDACEVWVPTQNPDGTRLIAAEMTGFPLSLIDVHVTFLGCGLGRRQETDFVIEAIELSKEVGVPVKVVWTREDDLCHDFYHPAAFISVEAAIGDGNNITGWRYRVASTSIWKRIAFQYADLLYLRKMPRPIRKVASKAAEFLIRRYHDPNIPEGARDIPYDFPNILIDYTEINPGVNTGPWRSVGYFNNIFAVESFVDELASEIGMDPYSFRLRILKDNPRQRGVLTIAARESKWDSAPSPGTARGMATFCCLGTYVAMVAEIFSRPLTDFKVTHITCAVDCGKVVNPNIATAQIEGGIAFGLAATLRQSITFREGMVEERNFTQYPLLRFSEMPKVRVVLAASSEPPTGLGEISVPGVAPAVCNALFALTGKRYRRLPLFKNMSIGQ